MMNPTMRPEIELSMTANECIWARARRMKGCAQWLVHSLSQRCWVVAPSDALETACLQLIEMANQGGGEDAFTVIEARFDGERRLSSSEKTISASLHIN